MEQMRLDQARARSTDPATSHEAARSVRAITAKQHAVLRVFAVFGKATDEQWMAKYATYEAQWNLPYQSASGLRTRRSELVRAGAIVDTGERQKMRSGRMAIVWEVLRSDDL
jgi:hypothetical protein